MAQHGFSSFVMRGNYFIASTADNDEVSEHIGQYRVKYHSNECGMATVIAQQISNEGGEQTFRKWNPEKLNVPFGQSTDADADTTCGNPLCCYICMCVNCCMGALFEEVVDTSRDGKLTSEGYF